MGTIESQPRAAVAGRTFSPVLLAYALIVLLVGANAVAVNETKGTITVDPQTLSTNRPGVFGGGDVATGPNTVVDAIAAGKRAAVDTLHAYRKVKPAKKA